MMEDCKGNFKLNNKYNSLSDQNLVHYFENEGIQRHLWQTGQVSPKHTFTMNVLNCLKVFCRLIV